MTQGDVASAPFVVDAHNDLLLELTHRRTEENPFRQYWLGKMAAGGVRLQVCPIYAGLEHLPEAALRRSLEQIVACYRAVAENGDRVVLVRSSSDLLHLASDDRLGLMLAMEGAEPLGYDPELADIFWELGVRMFGLTWNRRNAFADGAAERSEGGLSRLGCKLVDRLVSLGAILDLAHASERTFFDVLDRVASAPLVVSHSACRALVDTPRNLGDRQLEALAARDGVLGILAHPLVIDPAAPTLQRLVDHIDHAVAVMGIEHVGLGTDFIRQVALSGAIQTPPDALLPEGLPMETAIEELGGPEDFTHLVDALVARGYDGERLELLLGGNWLRVFERALSGAA